MPATFPTGPWLSLNLVQAIPDLLPVKPNDEESLLDAVTKVGRLMEAAHPKTRAHFSDGEHEFASEWTAFLLPSLRSEPLNLFDRALLMRGAAVFVRHRNSLYLWWAYCLPDFHRDGWLETPWRQWSREFGAFRVWHRNAIAIDEELHRLQRLGLARRDPATREWHAVTEVTR